MNNWAPVTMSAVSSNSDYIDGRLQVRTIAFQSGQEICRGVHYRPSIGLMNTHEQQPCVILAHGFGGTVESGLHAYGKAFSDAGLHAVIFDYRHFGSSDGEPRQYLSLKLQLQDWHAAIAFARKQPSIDATRIALWGVSLSGGLVIDVAAEDEDIRGVIAEFPMLDGFAALMNIYHYAGISQILKLLGAGCRDAVNRLCGGRPFTIPIVGLPGELAALATADAESGYRWIAPSTWRNEICAAIALAIPFYRPGLRLEHIRAPILIQIADHDTILPVESIERFVNKSSASLRVEHYPSGHFDAFSGVMFESAVSDQIQFLMSHLYGRNHENEPT